MNIRYNYCVNHYRSTSPRIGSRNIVPYTIYASRVPPKLYQIVIRILVTIVIKITRIQRLPLLQNRQQQQQHHRQPRMKHWQWYIWHSPVHMRYWQYCPYPSWKPICPRITARYCGHPVNDVWVPLNYHVPCCCYNNKVTKVTLRKRVVVGNVAGTQDNKNNHQRLNENSPMRRIGRIGYRN